MSVRGEGGEERERDMEREREGERERGVGREREGEREEGGGGQIVIMSKLMNDRM